MELVGKGLAATQRIDLLAGELLRATTSLSALMIHTGTGDILDCDFVREAINAVCKAGNAPGDLRTVLTEMAKELGLGPGTDPSFHRIDRLIVQLRDVATSAPGSDSDSARSSRSLAAQCNVIHNAYPSLASRDSVYTHAAIIFVSIIAALAEKRRLELLMNLLRDRISLAGAELGQATLPTLTVRGAPDTAAIKAHLFELANQHQQAERDLAFINSLLSEGVRDLKSEVDAPFDIIHAVLGGGHSPSKPCVMTDVRVGSRTSVLLRGSISSLPSQAMEGVRQLVEHQKNRALSAAMALLATAFLPRARSNEDKVLDAYFTVLGNRLAAMTWGTRGKMGKGRRGY